MDVDGRLPVHKSSEHFFGAGRDGSVAGDQTAHHASHGFNAERQRRDVKQQHILYPAGQNAGLDRCAQRHDLVGIQFAVRLFAEEDLDLLPDHGDTRGAAH